jgi:glycosyltransferase involved in cell wall biosynthesis
MNAKKGNGMKKISIVVPTFNEEKNVLFVYDEVTSLMSKKLSDYDYEILFIDNFSNDKTRDLVEELCAKDKKIKAIFNARDFGQASSYYGLINATGDCAVMLHADLQNPPEYIPQFVEEWEKGHKIVIGIKKKTDEAPIMTFLRFCYYKVMRKIAVIEHIEQFTDFYLLDRNFLELLKEINDPNPYLRGLISELGVKIKRIPFYQKKRLYGKSHGISFKNIFGFGMLGVVNYTRVPLHLATLLGFIFSLICFIIAIISLINKILYWDSYPAGIATLIVGLFMLSSLQIFFIGMLGEYILSINTRIMASRKPIVVEEKRINFEGVE